MTPQLLLRIFGIVFILVAVWGFIDGQRVLIFHVNTAHNVVHLLSGLVLVGASFLSAPAARATSLTFGIVYGLVALLGFAGVTAIVDLLHLNMADNWLHLVLAIPFVLIGLKPRPVLARA